MLLNSLMGFTSAHTIKVWGLLGTRKIVVLVDNGASHSFIASKFFHELDIPCEATARLGVQVGNGMSFKHEGVCRGLQLCIQECDIMDDFFSFELGSVDLVLGVTWLQTLGEVRSDWSRFTMSFL